MSVCVDELDADKMKQGEEVEGIHVSWFLSSQTQQESSSDDREYLQYAKEEAEYLILKNLSCQ